MRINDHILDHPAVTRFETANMGGAMTPEYLIIHYTAGRDGLSSAKHFQDPAAKASAHLVIGRDAAAWQVVPFNRQAWHAGVSNWAGRAGLNGFSIGIELDNAGRLTKAGDRYQAWFGASYPANDVIQARHKNEDQDAYWEIYTEPQMTKLIEISRLLVSNYGLKDILGHEDIAPGRKSDPGPAFSMQSFKASIIGRADDSHEQYSVAVDALNIRGGPGASYPTVGSPLTRGARVALLEMQSMWANVRLLDESLVEGWVRNSFITKEA